MKAKRQEPRGSLRKRNDLHYVKRPRFKRTSTKSIETRRFKSYKKFATLFEILNIATRDDKPVVVSVDDLTELVNNLEVTNKVKKQTICEMQEEEPMEIDDDGTDVSLQHSDIQSQQGNVQEDRRDESPPKKRNAKKKNIEEIEILVRMQEEEDEREKRKRKDKTEKAKHSEPKIEEKENISQGPVDITEESESDSDEDLMNYDEEVYEAEEAFSEDNISSHLLLIVSHITCKFLRSCFKKLWQGIQWLLKNGVRKLHEIYKTVCQKRAMDEEAVGRDESPPKKKQKTTNQEEKEILVLTQEKKDERVKKEQKKEDTHAGTSSQDSAVRQIVHGPPQTLHRPPPPVPQRHGHRRHDYIHPNKGHFTRLVAEHGKWLYIQKFNYDGYYGIR